MSKKKVKERGVMKKFFCLMLVLAMIFTAYISVQAADTQINVNYDAANGEINITGYANGFTSIMILPYGTDVSSIGDGNPPLDFVYFTSYGSFIKTLYMPVGSTPGKYTLHMSDSLATDSKSFIYYIASDADGLANGLKSETTLTGYTAYLKNNASGFGVDNTESIFTANIDLAAKYMFYTNPSFSGSAELQSVLNTYLEIASLNGKTTAQANTILSSNESVFGIDYSDDFAVNSDGVKSQVLSYLAKMDYSEEYNYIKDRDGSVDFKSILLECVKFAKIKNTTTYTELYNVYKAECYDIMTANSDYSDSTMSKSIFSEMRKMSYDSLSDIKDNFNAAVIIVNTPGYGTGGTNNNRPSGGGGGGGISFTAPPVSEDKEGINDDYDEDIGMSDPEMKVFIVPSFQSDKTSSFTDLASDHWAYDSISAMYDKKMVSGYEDGSFRPNSYITRAEFAKMIAGAFSINASKAAKFNDVTEGAWYFEAVNMVADHGIINGTGDGNFSPDNLITRQDAFVILYNCSKVNGTPLSGVSEFDDITDVDYYAIPAVLSLGGNGIINGDGSGRLNPKNNITRAEAAKLITNFAAKINS